MNIDNMKTFLAVYRAGSFVKVAKDRNVAPSSISRAIAALEESLKTRLFQRSTRQLTPTLAGEAYFEKIEPLNDEINLINQLLIDTTTKPSGRLRITSSVSYGQVVIAPKLAEFRKQYPDIQLELFLSDGRIDLINDQIDLAIRHGSLEDSNLIARKLNKVKYHLVTSHKYIEQHGIPSAPDELKEHDLVTFTYNDFKHSWSFNKGDVSQSISIEPVLTASNALAIQECVREGLGIALLADWTVENALKSGALVELLTDWKISGSTDDTSIYLLSPSNRFIPAKTKVFTEFLLDSLQ